MYRRVVVQLPPCFANINQPDSGGGKIVYKSNRFSKIIISHVIHHVFGEGRSGGWLRTILTLHVCCYECELSRRPLNMVPQTEIKLTNPEIFSVLHGRL